MLNWYRKIVSIITSASLVLMTLLVILQVIFRYVFNNSLAWSESLAIYMQVYITFLGAALALRKGMHVGIDFFLLKLKGKVRLRVIMFNYSLVALFSLVLLVGGTQIVLQQITYGQIVPLFVPIPMYIVYIAIPLGGLFMFIESIIYIIERHKESRSSEIAESK